MSDERWEAKKAEVLARCVWDQMPEKGGYLEVRRLEYTERAVVSYQRLPEVVESRAALLIRGKARTVAPWRKDAQGEWLPATQRRALFFHVVGGWPCETQAEYGATETKLLMLLLDKVPLRLRRVFYV